VTKVYRFRSKFPLTAEEAARFENGLVLEDGYETLPAKISLEGDGDCGEITLTEGKYHQIKRMLESLNNRITYLERVRFGPLSLDPLLARGEWRYLTDAEIAALEAHGTQEKETGGDFV
jgi:16S rRNA pseudouridine516 synthase